MKYLISKVIGSLLTIESPLMKTVIKPLPRSDLIPLVLTAATSAADVGIHKKINRSSRRSFDLAPQSYDTRLIDLGMTILITSNEKIVDIIKIVKSFDDFGLSIKGVTKRVENEAKEEKGGFLGILLSTLENLLSDKRVTHIL